MSPNSISQSAAPRSLAICASPEITSGPANCPPRSFSHDVSTPNESNTTSTSEFESSSNGSTLWQDNNAEPVANEVRFPKVPTHKALGWFTITVLVGGTIIVLAALSFLIFLWYGEGTGIGGEHATSAWRNIMLNEWLPQVITLTSLAMRVTIAAQTTLCTSMCAALILEKRRVRKSHAAQFSIARSVNDGPWTLILILILDVPSQIALHPESLLIVFLGLAAFGTQFASTILLSDLSYASLADFPSTASLNLTAASDTLMVIDDPYWSQRPRAFASFGESPPGYFAQPNQHGLSDTGIKRRALLPFPDSDNRTALRNYEGQAFVLSSRVACMPPVFSESQFTATNYSDLFDYGYISGKLDYEKTLAKAGIPPSRLCNSERCLPSSFECNIFAISGKAGKGYSVDTFCFPDLIPAKTPEASYWDLNDDPWGPEASSILVITSEVYENYWNESRGEHIPTPNYTLNGEWANFELQPGYFVNISLCFMGLNVMFSEVNLTSSADKTTNTAEKRANLSGPVINTTDIQVLLGADPSIQSFTERGVFEVNHIEDDPNHVFITDKNHSLTLGQNNTSVMESYLINTAQAQRPNSTISVCNPCVGFSAQASNPLYANIFSYILRRSNRAAVALQSVFTILGQTVYYDLLEKYDQTYATHIQSSKTIRIPQRSKGLIAVIILVISSLVAIGALTALFSRHSQYTFLGDSWHTLSQVVSFETETILNEKVTLADSKVRNNLKGEDYYVKLEPSPVSGRVELVRWDPINKDGV
ncbi:hypothetical protein FHL15_007397 [Xylaria flabelliformis]|uniref:Uncharacterized protein n=1 Tax=Xylaria flabelliformis TaxID=2512241 RepID=A0A553HUJ0_9PEZI|nr:hypothetical protein FHL15_007397 [Xylaria flabelliformis]